MATAAELAIRIQARENTKAAFDRVRKHVKDTESSLDKASKRMASFGASMTKVTMGLALGVGVPLAAVGGAFTKMAMDATESENLFAVSMGKMADDARRWSESLSDSLKLNSYNVRESVGTMNQMLNSMGLGEDAAYSMAKGLTQLSYDLSSFYNLSTDDAFVKLQAGITGEGEALKRLGIIVNETTTEQWALSQGLIKQGQEMSDAQKVLARYGVIMESTANAQGDLARTLDSPTNQLRAMKAQFEEIGIEVGQNFLPILGSALKWISDEGLPAAKGAVAQFKDSWTEMSDEAKRRLVFVATLMLGGGPLLQGIAAGIKGVAQLAKAFALLEQVAMTSLGRIATAATVVGGAALISERIVDDQKAKAETIAEGYDAIANGADMAGDHVAAAVARSSAAMAREGTVIGRAFEGILKGGINAAGELASDAAGAFDKVAGAALGLGEAGDETRLTLDNALKSAEGLAGGFMASISAGIKELSRSQDTLSKAGKIDAWLEQTYQGAKQLEEPLKIDRKLFDSLGESAQAAASKMGKSLSEAVGQFVNNLVAVHPAVLRVQADIEGWGQKIADINLAIRANQDQAKAAQREYEGMSKRLAELNRQLSDAQQKLTEFSRPKLKGSGQMEMQISAVEAQLKRIDLAEIMGVPLEAVMKQFPLMTKGAERFLAGLTTDKGGLQAFLEQLRLTESLKFDEKMALLATAAEDAVAEMTFDAAMAGIIATKEQIDGLTEAVSTQEAAMVRQQEVIDSIDRASEALTATLSSYQEQLRLAEERQGLMTDALKLAYTWLLEDRTKIMEMGGEAVIQAGVVDEQTRILLTSLDLYALGVKGSVQGTIDAMVGAYKKGVDDALAELARLPGVPSGAPRAGGGVESHAGGGIVGGPVGQPRVIIAHGGERVSRPWESGGRQPVQVVVTGNTFLADDRTTAKEIARLLKPELDGLVRMR